MTDIMIDIETWATTEDAAIRAAALIAFDPNGEGDQGYLLIDARNSIDDQIDRGRSIDPSTVAWWRTQTPLWDAMTGHERIEVMTLAGLVTEIENFTRPLLAANTSCIWTRGHFNVRILQNAFLSLDPDANRLWAYYQEADVRTLDQFTARVPSEHPNNPLADCMAQIRQVRNAFTLKAVSQETKKPLA